MKKQTPPSDKVGYKRPPKSTRFKPGESGNPTGTKKLKRRDIARDIQGVFTRPIAVRDGAKTKKVPRIVALIEIALIDAMKGDKRATQFCYKVAENFGVFRLRDEVQFNFDKLTAEERDICLKGAQLLHKAGALFRYDRDK